MVDEKIKNSTKIVSFFFNKNTAEILKELWDQINIEKNVSLTGAAVLDLLLSRS